MEHRWGDRRRVILEVRLYGPGQIYTTGSLTDISLSGAYVRTTSRLAVMSQVTVEVDDHSIPSAAPRPLRLHGRVVRHGPTGIGVEWEEFASGKLSGIER